MRALHLVPGNLYGGVESFLSLIARRPDLSPGVEQHFGLCFEGRLAQEIEASGAGLHRLGVMRTSRPWTVLRGRARLRELLTRTRFDVALAHSSWPQAMFGPVLRRAGIPNVFYLHGPLTEVSWLDRWAARHPPARVIAVSRHTLGSSQLIYPGAVTEVLHCPMPFPERSMEPGAREAVRAELGATASEVVLLQASRAEPWKGHDQLLQALAQLRDMPGWRLWLAGGAQRPKEAAFLERLRRQVAETGLTERVQFLGERRDVPRLLAGADLYCQANRGPEGFSIAFLEAFAAGLPIVTMRLGGAPEIIDETTGILVPEGDITGFAQALRELIPATERRRTMGERAKVRAGELGDPAVNLAELCRILRETVAERVR